MKLYPFEMPDTMHQLGWMLLGFGLDADSIDKLAKHLFDDLGLRLSSAPPETVTFEWQVSWPRPPKDGRMKVERGDTLDLLVSDTAAVQVIGGALPPGIRLEKHTGKLVGQFEQAGLFSVTLRTGPAVKYDPLGTFGTPETIGQWIPVDQPRQALPVAAAPPKDLSSLTPLELDELIVQAQRAQLAKLIKEADSGN